MGEVPGRSFEREWSDVASQLNALLTGKRIPASKREDIVQETGLRLFKMWDAVDPERPVWPLAVTICLNLLRDEARRGVYREVLGDVPDQPEHHDVEQAGLARLEFKRVCKAMASLSPAHRSVLMFELGGDQRKPASTAATKMLRMRARRKLQMVLESASASGLAVAFRMRRAFESFGQVIGGRALHGNPAEIAAAGAALVTALAMGLPGFSWSQLQLSPPSDATVTADGSVFGTRLDLAGATGSLGTNDAAALAELNKRRMDSNARNRGIDEPVDDGSVSVPLPYNGRLAGEGNIEVFGYGGRVGDNDGGAPVCVSGFDTSSISCGGEQSRKTRAHVKASADTAYGEVGAEAGVGND